MSRLLPAWLSLRQPILPNTKTSNHGGLFRNNCSSKLRFQSTKTTGPPQAASTISRFDRFIARTPTKFLRNRLQVLKNAPLTHVTAFLLLHEVTAIVPLFGLASAFHYYEWLPPYFAEGAWVLKGVSMFGNYFRRKGWIDAADADEAKTLAKEGRAEDVEKPEKKGLFNVGKWFNRGEAVEEQKSKKSLLNVGKWWTRGEGGTRVIIEFATAYAIVKALMPIRIVISVWGAPWFARCTVIPAQNAIKRWWSRRKG